MEYFNLKYILEGINEGFITKKCELIYYYLDLFFKQNQDVIKFQLHPLGFKYLRFGSISEHFDFRLHFWSNTNQNQGEEFQIHDHSFDFESLVINGKIKNTKFNIFPHANSEGFIYEVQFRNENSKLIMKSENQNINIINCENILKDNFYSMKNYEFHKSTNLSENTLTIIKIDRTNNKIARVYSSKKKVFSSSFDRTHLNIEENKIIVNKVKEILLAKT